MLSQKRRVPVESGGEHTALGVSHKPEELDATRRAGEGFEVV